MNEVFVDTETTGLDPDRHEVWEIAIIRDGEEHLFQVLPDLTVADPTALRISRFYSRFNRPQDPRMGVARLAPQDVAEKVAELTAERHIVGAVPSFDAEFLKRFLLKSSFAPAWHYHLVDVEALAAGKLRYAPPWDSTELTKALGITVPEEDKHTALGDARWAKLIYEAVLGG